MKNATARILIGTLAAALVIAIAWQPAAGEDKATGKGSPSTTVVGVSPKGNLNDAFDDAFNKIPVEGDRKDFRLVSVTGSKGGIVGETTVRVELEVSVSKESPKP